MDRVNRVGSFNISLLILILSFNLLILATFKLIIVMTLSELSSSYIYRIKKNFIIKFYNSTT